jgi:hypothetical protein
MHKIKSVVVKGDFNSIRLHKAVPELVKTSMLTTPSKSQVESPIKYTPSKNNVRKLNIPNILLSEDHINYSKVALGELLVATNI